MSELTLLLFTLPRSSFDRLRFIEHSISFLIDVLFFSSPLANFPIGMRRMFCAIVSWDDGMLGSDVVPTTGNRKILFARNKSIYSGKCLSSLHIYKCFDFTRCSTCSLWASVVDDLNHEWRMCNNYLLSSEHNNESLRVFSFVPATSLMVNDNQRVIQCSRRLSLSLS